MARAKPDWVKARAMYEAGIPLRQITSEAFIDHSNINKRAKKEGWIKNPELPRLIADGVSVRARLENLTLPQKDVITTEIAAKLQDMQFYKTQARRVTQIAMAVLEEQPTSFSAKTTMATLKDGLIVEGLVPFYSNATTINNTNAQQNNIGLSELLSSIDAD